MEGQGKRQSWSKWCVVSKAKGCGKAVTKEGGSFLFEVVGKFVKCKVRFCGEIAKAANRFV